MEEETICDRGWQPGEEMKIVSVLLSRLLVGGNGDMETERNANETSRQGGGLGYRKRVAIVAGGKGGIRKQETNCDCDCGR